MKYPLAPNGIFRSIQGEGALLGVPMTFIRLAGCSVGCPLCDTDYRVDRRSDVEDIVQQVIDLTPGRFPWVWITGGEPTDHDLEPLRVVLVNAGMWVALATSGVRKIPGLWSVQYDWLSVSPHSADKWVQRMGSEIKLIPGLNALELSRFESLIPEMIFGYKFVSPCDGKPETVRECVDWVERHPGWKMTGQLHKLWSLA